jgi:hypothetical protein
MGYTDERSMLNFAGALDERSMLSFAGALDICEDDVEFRGSAGLITC